MADSNDCSLCGHDIKTLRCKCPWHMPFEKWPRAILDKLHPVIKDGWPGG
jgi:hypothetical protein